LYFIFIMCCVFSLYLYCVDSSVVDAHIIVVARRLPLAPSVALELHLWFER